MPGSNKTRDLRSYQKSFPKSINNKYVKLDIVFFGGYLKLNEFGEPDSVQVFGPQETPLNKYLKENKQLQQELMDVCVQTIMGKYDDEALVHKEGIRRDIQDIKTKKIRKPQVPVSVLLCEDSEKYFPRFVNIVATFFHKVESWISKKKIVIKTKPNVIRDLQ